MDLIYALLLGFAVSLDSCAAGVAYGLKNIRMPYKSLAVVGFITAVYAAAAIFCASALGQFFDAQLAVIIGSLLLISLGGFSLFQEFLTSRAAAYETDGKATARQLTFSLGKLVISIMAKPETADIDHSKSISPLEALFLGLALGLDNMVAAFAASLIGALPPYTPIIMGAVQAAFIAAGSLAGRRLVSDSWKKNFPFLPGTILILIGLMRLG